MRSLFNYDVASELKLSSTIAGGLLPLPKYWLGKIEIAKVDFDDSDDEGTIQDQSRKRRSSTSKPKALRKKG